MHSGVEGKSVSQKCGGDLTGEYLDRCLEQDLSLSFN
jgi:hypothetical protein